MSEMTRYEQSCYDSGFKAGVQSVGVKCKCREHADCVCDICAFPFGGLRPHSECPVCKGNWGSHSEWQQGYCQDIYRANIEDVEVEDASEFNFKLDKEVEYTNSAMDVAFHLRLLGQEIPFGLVPQFTKEAEALLETLLSNLSKKEAEVIVNDIQDQRRRFFAAEESRG